MKLMIPQNISGMKESRHRDLELRIWPGEKNPADNCTANAYIINK